MKKLVIVLTIILSFMFYIDRPKADNIEEIGIDIKGSIINPGFYKLSTSSTVYDAIKASGGLKDNADTSIINLSKKLKDQDVIIVYSIDEVNEMRRGDTSIKIIEKECVCPKLDNSACIDSNVSIKEDNNKINLNTASIDQLQTLSGIGKSKADSIIKYRETTPFKTIEDLMNVKGIGKGIFEKIKDNITV